MSNFKNLLSVGIAVLAFCVLSTGLAQAQTLAYVTNADDNTVSVINPTDGSTVATISVGLQPYGIAATPDGTRVYAVNALSNTVSVIDTATNTVAATIPVGAFPKGIAILPDGTKAYVANHSGGTVSVIDLTTNTVSGIIGVGSGPSNIAFTPESPPRAYVTNTFSGNLSVIDTGADVVLVSSIGVGGNPEGIAIDADGIAYVANRANGVNVIDTSVIFPTFILLPGRNVGVAVSGKRVYVTNNGNGLLQVGDFSGWAPGTFPGPTPTWNTINIGPQPVGVALTPDQSQAWVANSAEFAIPAAPGNVAVVDNTATPPAVFGSPISAGAQPTWIAFATLDTGGSTPETFDFDLALQRIKIFQHGRQKDYFWVNGRIILAPESDGINLPEEDFSITIGPTTYDLPAGSFVGRWGSRILVFRGMVGDAWMQVFVFKTRQEGHYGLTVLGRRGAFPGITNPVTVGLVLGNDSGEATKTAFIR